MSFDGSGSWLVLDGASLPEGWGEHAPTVKRAQGVLEAALHLAKSPPAAVVVNPKLGWHDTFVRLLPPDRRFKVIVTSETSPDRRGPTDASASAG